MIYRSNSYLKDEFPRTQRLPAAVKAFSEADGGDLMLVAKQANSTYA